MHLEAVSHGFSLPAMGSASGTKIMRTSRHLLEAMSYDTPSIDANLLEY